MMIKNRYQSISTLLLSFCGISLLLTSLAFAQKSEHKENESHTITKPMVGHPEPDAWLREFLKTAAKVPSKKAKKALEKVLKDPQTYKFQLLITEYIKDESDHVKLIPHSYRVDYEYFYPASAVKVYGSLAALRHFTLIKKEYSWLTTDDPMSQNKKTCKSKDHSNESNQLASLEHEIKKTELISSNKAFNTVFNVTGFRTLHEYILPDFPSVRVFHRLSSRETHQECLKTPSLKICDWTKSGINNKKSYQRKRFVSEADISDLEAKIDLASPTGFGLNKDSLLVGKAYKHMKTKKIISKPMDFSFKNRVSFYDFQRMMIGMYLTKEKSPFGPPIQLFNGEPSKGGIRTTWLRELRHSMAIYPRHSENPKYSGAGLSERRFKPLITGVRLAKGKPVEEQNLYYLNKAGKALGFHVDNAFIATGYKAGHINKKTGYPEGKLKKGFFITVGLYVNKDQTLNDDKYEYKQISVPVFKALGYAVGQYLKK